MIISPPKKRQGILCARSPGVALYRARMQPASDGFPGACLERIKARCSLRQWVIGAGAWALNGLGKSKTCPVTRGPKPRYLSHCSPEQYLATLKTNLAGRGLFSCTGSPGRLQGRRSMSKDKGLPTAPQHGPGIGSSGPVPPPVKSPSTTPSPLDQGEGPQGLGVGGEFSRLHVPPKSVPRSKF